MRAVLLASALTLTPPARAGGTSVSFDSRGAGPAAVLQALKSGTSGVPGVAGRPLAEGAPLIVTIPGIAPEHLGAGLELGHLEQLWRWLFPGRSPSMKALADERASLRPGRLAEDFGFMGPDDYVADAAREVSGRAGYSLEIVNIPWSRDPTKTRAEVAKLTVALRRISEEAGGRPVYLLCHSWGSVMVHEALWRLAAEGRPVPVRRFVSMGSSLVPARVFTWLFREYHRVVSGVSAPVRKPPGVEVWVNFWAGADPYSGSIPAADLNIRVDPDLPDLVRRVRETALHDTPWNTVEADLYALTNAGRWHGSYFHGFRAHLASLGLDVDWDVPQTVLTSLAR